MQQIKLLVKLGTVQASNLESEVIDTKRPLTRLAAMS